jgi:hypothetical protein
MLLLFVCFLTGCVHVPPAAGDSQITALRRALTSLHPDVQDTEAGRLATVAYGYPRQLARDYRLVRPPLFHNLLINLRLKKRGLCYQWAEDMVAQLQTLRLESVELHWGSAAAGKLREHNTVVVTGPGQPFADGIVLDPWRRSGELVWVFVAADSYVWQEGELFAQPPPPRVATQTATP